MSKKKKMTKTPTETIPRDALYFFLVKSRYSHQIENNKAQFKLFNLNKATTVENCRKS